MENESLHEFVIRGLQERKGQWRKVAEGSGVPYKTLEKVARREVADPGVSICEKLAAFFRDNPANKAA